MAVRFVQEYIDVEGLVFLVNSETKEIHMACQIGSINPSNVNTGHQYHLNRPTCHKAER